MRRAEIGHHHHIAGTYLLRYAQEAIWREDNRRVTNGEQTCSVAALAMKREPSVDFGGYWQRHLKFRRSRSCPTHSLATSRIILAAAVLRQRLHADLGGQI